MANRKELQLIIKQKYFDQILSGLKTKEIREVRPATAKRYIDFKDGVNDIDNINRPVPYTALRLFVGYKKNRPEILVEVTARELVFLTSEDGEDITYEHEGDTYLACQMEYTLGEILERKNLPEGQPAS